MKRKKKSTKNYLGNVATPHYTLFFWDNCSLCGLDFRRERGWKIRTFRFYGHPIYSYCCATCASSADEVAEKFQARFNAQSKRITEAVFGKNK